MRNVLINSFKLKEAVIDEQFTLMVETHCLVLNRAELSKAAF